MKELLDDKRLKILETEQKIKVIQKKDSSERISEYEYTGEERIKVRSPNSDSFHIKKQKSENIILKSFSGEDYVIGQEISEGNIKIKVPEKLIEEIEDVVRIQKTTICPDKNVDTEIEGFDIEGQKIVLNDIVKGARYEVRLEMAEKEMHIDGVCIKDDENKEIDLDNYFSEKIKIQIPDFVEEGEIEITDGIRFERFDINTEEIGPLDVAFIDDEGFFEVNQKQVKSEKFSYGCFVMRILPDNYSPVLIREIETKVSLSSSNFRELVSFEIDPPEILNESIGFNLKNYKIEDVEDISLDYSFIEESKYFLLEENKIKNCIPSSKIKISEPSNPVGLRAIRLEIGEDDESLSREELVGKIGPVDISIYSESDGYLLVHTGREKLIHHESGKLKSYRVSYGDRIILNGPSENKVIEIDEETILKGNITVGSELSGF